jgi:hypothetical protein
MRGRGCGPDRLCSAWAAREADGATLCAGVTTTTVRHPHEFFFDLYHRFLLATNQTLRSMALQAMAIVYGAYARQIGPFNDMRFVVKMLSSAQTRIERDRYLIFIDKARRGGRERVHRARTLGGT